MNTSTPSSMDFEEILLRSGRRLDENQRKAVDCDLNCVVSAGAGSGKTTVLTYRFLRLLLEEKAHADTILTLTFTRKAAAEMHERIHSLLSSLKDFPSMAAELARFPQAQISTLDSFCSSIVRSDCMRYGLTSDFSIDDDTTRTFARACAVELLAREDAGARLLSVLYTPDALLDSFLIPFATNAMDMSHQLDAGLDASLVRGYFSTMLDQALVRLGTVCREIAALPPEGKAVTLSSARTTCSSFLEQYEGWAEGEETYRQTLLFCTAKENDWRSPGKVSEGSSMALLKDMTPAYREARTQAGVFACAMLSVDNLMPLYTFLQEYQELFYQRKRATGILTFSDVAHLAVDILRVNPAVRNFYKKRFSHIMIDEFQDNNRLQKDLLYLLAEKQGHCSSQIPTASQLEPAKLFFVGDEKQSIYRFRGADVSVFKQLGNEIRQGGGVALELGTNYRTEPALIGLFNELFKRIMNPGGQAYEADFLPLGGRQPSPGLISRLTLMHQPLNDREEDPQDPWLTTDDAEAYAVAGIIEEILTTDSYLIPNGSGGLKRPQPSDIGLLFRTGGSQMSYEKALRARAIPYSLQVSRALLLEAPANDLYAWLQLCIYPTDSVAYATALRSPLCGIMDDSLIPVMQDYKKGQPLEQMRNTEETDDMDGESSIEDEALPRIRPEDPHPFRSTCIQEAWFQQLSPDVQDRYRHGVEVYQNLQQKVEAGSVADAIAFLWYDCGYRMSLLAQPAHHVYLEHFDSLWELALQFDFASRSIVSFLDYLRPLLGDNEKLGEVEPLKEDPAGVQILSIHKSKGLEFPIVIVSGMGRGGAASRTPEWFDLEFSPQECPPDGRTVPVPLHMPADNPSGVTNAAYFQAKAELDAKEQAELKRLLYVALTRAQYHLVLSGSDTRTNRGDSAPDKFLYPMVLSALDTARQGDGTSYPLCTMVDIEPVTRSQFYSSTSTAVRKDAVGRWYTDGQTVEPDFTPLRRAVTDQGQIDSFHGRSEGELFDHSPQLPSLPGDAVISQYGLQTIFGTYVHALLSHALVQGSLPTGKERDKLFPMDRPDGMGMADYRMLLEGGIQLARGFLSSQFWQDIKKQAQSWESEVGFFFRNPEGDAPLVYEGVADVVVHYPDSILIIDFKTDSMLLPETHRHQLTLYCQAFSRLSGKKTEAALCYLRSPDEVVRI